VAIRASFLRTVTVDTNKHESLGVCNCEGLQLCDFVSPNTVHMEQFLSYLAYLLRTALIDLVSHFSSALVTDCNLVADCCVSSTS